MITLAALAREAAGLRRKAARCTPATPTWTGPTPRTW